MQSCISGLECLFSSAILLLRALERGWVTLNLQGKEVIMSICSTAPSCLLACCCHSPQHHICLEPIILVFYPRKR